MFNLVPYARVEFKLIFQEIWDFKLVFLNWRATNIIPPTKRLNKQATTEEKKHPSTIIKIEFTTKSCGNNQIVVSEGSNNPE